MTDTVNREWDPEEWREQGREWEREYKEGDRFTVVREPRYGSAKYGRGGHRQEALAVGVSGALRSWDDGSLVDSDCDVRFVADDGGGTWAYVHFTALAPDRAFVFNDLNTIESFLNGES